MTMISPDDILINKEWADRAVDPLARVLQNLFYHKGITNRQYIDRYRDSYRERRPDASFKNVAQSAAVDRKFLIDPNKMSVHMAKRILELQGYKVVDIDKSDATAWITLLEDGKVFMYTAENVGTKNFPFQITDHPTSSD